MDHINFTGVKVYSICGYSVYRLSYFAYLVVSSEFEIIKGFGSIIDASEYLDSLVFDCVETA